MFDALASFSLLEKWAKDEIFYEVLTNLYIYNEMKINNADSKSYLNIPGGSNYWTAVKIFSLGAEVS